MNRQFKFRAWHPAYGMFDFRFNKFDFEIIDQGKEPLELINIGDIKIIDPTSIKSNRVLYLRTGTEKPASYAGTLTIADITLIDIEDPQLIIMQYLGEDCKDPQGIEFCEGDICALPYDYKEVGTLIYDGGEFFIPGYRDNIGIVKIIGNIHQNPELLNA